MHSPILLGLSGASSSGKTTIARLLRDIVPSTIILHEDDFYRPESELPLRAGLKDWDCAAAVDIAALVSVLEHIRREGRLPEDFVSKEDQNEVGESGVSSDIVEHLKDEVRSWIKDNELSSRSLIIVDGFLLFGRSVPEVREKFDIRILLRATFEAAKRRREARKGYVTLEGFWEDPEGYVELVVWPGYVEEHRSLFEGENVEGKVDETIVENLGIKVCPGEGKWGIEKMLRWTIEELKKVMAQEHKGNQGANVWKK